MMQRDLFNNKIYYYDLARDPASLGEIRDLLNVGDCFVHTHTSYRIIEKLDADQQWIIQADDSCFKSMADGK